MKLSSIAYISSIAALAGLPFLAPQADAAPSSAMLGQISLQFGGQAQPPPQQMNWDGDQRRQLRHIYWQLEHADRDYNGHRHWALDDIRRAAQDMGMDLYGEGYGQQQPEGMSQRWSDHDLRHARDEILNLANNSGGPIRHDLFQAVHQLDQALANQ